MIEPSAREGVAVVLPIARDLDPRAHRAYAATLLRAVSGIGACFLLVGGLAGAAYPSIDTASVTVPLSTGSNRLASAPQRLASPSACYPANAYAC